MDVTSSTSAVLPDTAVSANVLASRCRWERDRQQRRQTDKDDVGIGGTGPSCREVQVAAIAASTSAGRALAMLPYEGGFAP